MEEKELKIFMKHIYFPGKKNIRETKKLIELFLSYHN